MRFALFFTCFFVSLLAYGQHREHYDRAFRLLQEHKQIKSEEGRSQDIRFKNFQPQLDRLEEAFTQIDKLVSSYQKLSEAEKRTLPSYRELDALREGIAATAADVLRKAPYAESHLTVYRKPAYDDPGRRDTLIALRRILVVQTNDFLQTFTQTRALATVRELRRTLLEEFRTLPALRQSGTGRGYRYEENCTEVLDAFSPEELSHILPEFYGAEFDPDRAANFEKLKALAERFDTDPLSFLCTLSLHFEGLTPENEAHYDAFIQTFAPQDIAFVAVQRKAAPFLRQKDWQRAEEVFAKYQSLFPESAHAFIRIQQLLRRPSDNIRLEALPAYVNTEKPETHPVVGYEGLYFCRSTEGTGQDVFFSDLRGSVERLSLNTRSHEVPQSISPDGTRLVLFGNYGLLPEYRVEMRAFNRDLGRGDLYFVERKGTKWTRIRPFPQPISTAAYEAGLSFVAGKSAVLFASDREKQQQKSPDNQLFFHGREDFNLDIWVAEQNEDGSWGEPINLGEQINTPFAESNPILHPDGRTLYFVSDGHPGLGGADLFMARRLDTTSWTSWSEPVNLGKSINSHSDDGFTLDANGEFAYVSLKATSSYDIFKFEIPERFQGDKKAQKRRWVNGKIQQTDKRQTRVRIQRLSTGQAEAETQTDTSGNFRVRLPAGRKYLVTAKQKDGAFSESGLIDLSQEEAETPLTLSPIQAHSTERVVEERESIVLKNIYFHFDSDTLRTISYPEIERLADLLRQETDLKVRIEGHTDSRGDESYNQQLSEQRAKRVADYLMFLGIEEKRVFYIGFGEGKPIASNQTDAGRALNRRVAFSLKAMTD